MESRRDVGEGHALRRVDVKLDHLAAMGIEVEVSAAVNDEGLWRSMVAVSVQGVPQSGSLYSTSYGCAGEAIRGGVLQVARQLGTVKSRPAAAGWMDMLREAMGALVADLLEIERRFPLANVYEALVPGAGKSSLKDIGTGGLS